MKIILEGCEGTGKTTLAKKLIERYGLDYVHITNKDPNDYMFYKQTLRKEDVIYDRHFIGEMIYPKVFSRKGNLDRNRLDKLFAFAEAQGACVLILTADIEEIKKRVAERGKYKPDFILRKLPQINEIFCRIGSENSCRGNVFTIDTSKTPFEEICKEIERCKPQNR